MKVKKNFIYGFIVAFICAILTIFLFYIANDIENDTLLIAIVGAFFSTLTMTIVISKIEIALNYTELSGPVVFLLVAVLYNQNSVIKYAVNSIYDGAIDNLTQRFFGALFIDILIVFGTYFWSWMHRNNKEFLKNSKKDFQQLTVPGYVVYFMVISYVLLAFLSIGYVKSKLVSVILTGYSYLCFSAVALYVKIYNNKYRLSSLIPIVLLGFSLFILSILGGSKQIIIRAAIVIVCALIFQNKLSFNKIKIALYTSPLIMQGLVSLTELISGRFINYSTEWMLRYHIFRYDLSDLAMTFAFRFDNLKYSWGIVKEAFLYSLPSFLYSSKEEILPMYNANVMSAGLEGYPMDYNDTVFSFGAQIGGFLGIVIAFFAVLFLHEWISKKLIRISRVGPAILMTVFGYFSYVESDLFMFVFNTRDLLVYIVLALVVYRIFLKIRKTPG